MASIHRIASTIGLSNFLPQLTKNHVPSDKLESPAGRQWDFEPYYAKHLSQLVSRYESKRTDALKKHRGRFAIAVVPGILLILSFFVLLFARDWHHLSEDTIKDSIFAATLMFFALAWWVMSPRIGYKQSVKQDVYPIIFKFFGEDFHFNHYGKLTAQELKPSGIIPPLYTQHIEDYIKGTYQGVALELTECTLSNGDSRYHRQVFRGIFVRIAMHKPFSGRTVLLRRKRLGRMFKSKEIKELQKVRLEGSEFHSRFDVFSSDQIEARYLLTTSFMERLIRFEEVMESKGLQASFYENYLLLMIPTKLDRFEGISFTEQVTFYHDINVILQEMSDIFAIIEHLKLHENTRL